jgi:hypothetical protein
MRRRWASQMLAVAIYAAHPGPAAAQEAAGCAPPPPAADAATAGSSVSWESVALLVSALAGIFGYILEHRRTQASHARQLQEELEREERDAAESRQREAHKTQLKRVETQMECFIQPWVVLVSHLLVSTCEFASVVCRDDAEKSSFAMMLGATEDNEIHKGAERVEKWNVARWMSGKVFGDLLPDFVLQRIRSEGAESPLARRYRRYVRHELFPILQRLYDLISLHGAAYNEPIAPEVYLEMFSNSYNLEWFKMQTRSWCLVDLQVYTDQFRLILLEWDDGEFESLTPEMPFNGMGAMYIGIKMQDLAGERQKELTGLSVTSGAGGARGDLADEVKLLEQALEKKGAEGKGAKVHPSP